MELTDFLRIAHPAIAVTVVFPIIGMVLNMAWQTRQRRIKSQDGSNSKIPPSVGMEHVKLGKVLSGAVVGISLLGMLHPTVKYILKNDLVNKDFTQVLILALLFIATIASLVFLYIARERLWLGIFATLTGMGITLIGFQDNVFKREGFGAIFRRDNEWMVSHFYFGIIATMLMIFSLAIVQDIYKDRQNRWRTAHVILNSIATLFFIGQGITGARDLLEIPLSWQEPFVYSCDFTNRVCKASIENPYLVGNQIGQKPNISKT
jgi:multidrug transporter EmrE-like cation transporter